MAGMVLELTKEKKMEKMGENHVFEMRSLKELENHMKQVEIRLDFASFNLAQPKSMGVKQQGYHYLTVEARLTFQRRKTTR